jgi:hypothetical protein
MDLTAKGGIARLRLEPAATLYRWIAGVIFDIGKNEGEERPGRHSLGALGK